MSNLQNNIIIEDIIETVEEEYPNLSSMEKYQEAQKRWQELLERTYDWR